jgi:hypothetical protein
VVDERLREAGVLETEMYRQTKNASVDAEQAGFDLSLMDQNLRLSPEQRIRQHDQALALVVELDRIRGQRDAKLEGITPTAR